MATRRADDYLPGSLPLSKPLTDRDKASPLSIPNNLLTVTPPYLPSRLDALCSARLQQLSASFYHRGAYAGRAWLHLGRDLAEVL